MRQVDFSLLRSFVMVVEAGGFTSAQGQVHRTQSTISQQVRRLEKHLGMTLLVRSKNGVIPTAEGERVLAYARRMLALESEMRQSIGVRREAATVRFGVTDDVAQLYLPKLLERARVAFPKTVLRVTCDLSVHLRDRLRRGDFDVIICRRTNIEGPGVPILREPIRWIASKKYSFDRKRPVPLVLFPHGCVYRARAIERLDATHQPWELAFESPSTVSVQAAIRSGLGVATLTSSSAPEGCRSITSGLPTLGDTELVYEFGNRVPEEAVQLLQEALSLIQSNGRESRAQRLRSVSP